MLRLALLQVLVPASPADIRECLAGTHPAGPEAPCCLACLPELFHTNYSSLPLHDQSFESSLLPAIGDFARRNPGTVIAGSLSAVRHGRRTNSLTMFHRDDVLPLYDKLHLFRPMREDAYFSPGDHLGILEMRCEEESWRVGFAICYDLRFPEMFRLLAGAGCELVVVVAQWPEVRIRVWKALLQARAAENQIYLAGVNRCGSDRDERFGGGSLIVAPDGSILAEAADEPQLLQSILDKAEIGRSRKAFYSFRERLEGAYRLTSGLPVNSVTVRPTHKSK